MRVYPPPASAAASTTAPDHVKRRGLWRITRVEGTPSAGTSCPGELGNDAGAGSTSAEDATGAADGVDVSVAAVDLKALPPTVAAAAAADVEARPLAAAAAVVEARPLAAAAADVEARPSAAAAADVEARPPAAAAADREVPPVPSSPCTHARSFL
jgi:hypothetical protein